MYIKIKKIKVKGKNKKIKKWNFKISKKLRGIEMQQTSSP